MYRSVMKIAVAGYGIEGKAVAQYFRRHQHEVTVCDQGKYAKKELEKSKIHMRLGPHYLENLEPFDRVFRSPGIPFLKKEFKSVRGKLTSLTKYFFENCPCPIVGITGTKGKGTVSALLYEMLKKGLLVTINSDDPAYFGGYINENYFVISEALNLSKEEICQLAKNSFNASFLNEKEKQKIIEKINEQYS